MIFASRTQLPATPLLLFSAGVLAVLLTGAVISRVAQTPIHKTPPVIEHHSELSQPVTPQDQQQTYTGLVAIPQYAADIAGFVPEGWELQGNVEDGDLNGDGLTDHAFIIKKNDSIDFTQGEALLVVVLAVGDNQLKRVCVSSHILDKAAGNYNGGDIQIKEGALIVSAGFQHFGCFFDFENSFRWHDGRFELVQVEHRYGNTGGFEANLSNTSLDVYETRTGKLHHRWSPQSVNDFDSDGKLREIKWLADRWILIKCTKQLALSDWSWDDPQLAPIIEEYEGQPKTGTLHHP